MKKLLHERLREWANDECKAPIEIIALRDACFEAARDAFLMMANEIERYYIPLPRFEDGEPIAIGDKFEYRSGSIDEVTRITYKYDDCFITGVNGCSIYASQAKRPSPKVLDADGVEIKVGDTVWLIGGADKPAIVEEIKDGWIRYSGGVFPHPESLTHKEPDSLQKIRYEMLNAYDRDIMVGTEKVKGWADRLSALIERED